MRQADAIALRNKRRNRFGPANRPLLARQPRFVRSREERHHRDRPVETSATLVPFGHLQTPSPHGPTVAKAASPCRIHPATAARLLCAAAEWIARCKALLRAAQMA